jgi:isochorismate synthase EntC
MIVSAVAAATMIVFMASLHPTPSVVGRPHPRAPLLLSHTRGRVLGTVAQFWYRLVVS